MDKNKAMKLALDALLIWEEMHPKTTVAAVRSPAIQALQEALDQEPVAWVGLTNEEREYLWGITRIDDEDRFAFVLAVEAKLKEKNT